METVNVSLVSLLKDIEFFDDFSQEETAALIGTAQWTKTRPGDQIITEGELDLFMYVLLQGQVDVVLKEKVLSTLTSGDTFGEFGLMGGRRTAHVFARTECLLLKFSAEQLNRMSTPLQIKFLKKILFTLFARLQKVNRRVWWELPAQWR
ncbi:MAG: cyclic nucleotide-binding domain-containing protein [Thermodesulfobacteriota bacterium]